ncbi:MAG: response regulator [Bdellovibrionaceae bacterium]|nr:response regulator [Pseudobdellovibrionaceae bacterium]|tara:strand:- start:2131 stop:2619 length:489 start_codon:yes stop_codon:yes gene_type:complete
MKKINAKDLVAKIERITKERMAKDDVISFEDLKKLKSKASQFTLLIIEDDETVRGVLKRVFEREDYKVLVASDGTQLSSVLDGASIDLIILDIGLPWINGFELAELMKQHEDLSDIPLIFISGMNSKEDIKRGFEVGADDYITKPFDLEKIKKAVKTLIQIS